MWDCPDALPTIETDPLLLEEILTNLLTNALKFTDRGQVIVSVLDRSEQGRIAFAVSDTGIGIPADDLEHIFDEFRQVDGSMTRARGGVGLGLTLVQKLTASLSGTVTVRSDPGVGSTFTVELPLRVHPAAATSAAA